MIRRSAEFLNDGNGNERTIVIGDHKVKVSKRENYEIIKIDRADIWDGANLALIREAIDILVTDKRRKIGVNLQRVQFVPSGFFGMLYDTYEEGIGMCLCEPYKNTKKFLWFRQFFSYQTKGNLFVLKDEPSRVIDSELSTDLSEI